VSGALRLVIDTDTASDDAVALMLALADPLVSIDAITVVAGNVPLPLAVRNALVTCDVMGRPDVPVHAGCAHPLTRPLETAQDVHGPDGMGGTVLPEPSRSVTDEHAVLALLRLAADAPGERTLITLGPLTNVAAALTIDPDLLTKFDHTWCMAGVSDANGNVTGSAEFNVWADPEACRIVLRAASPERVTFVGWDVSRKHAVLRPHEQARLVALGTQRADFVQRINVAVDHYCRTVTGLPGYDLPDPITVAAVLHPELVTATEIAHVIVALDDVGRGTLVIDRRPGAPAAPNLRLVTAMDGVGFIDLLLEMCAGGSPIGS
jgi:purine nucleosidase